MSIGENIRKRRKELHMSQQTLADLLAYKSKSTIAKIENGFSDITQTKLTAFANVLNTTVEYLTTGINNQDKNKNIVVSMSDDTIDITDDQNAVSTSDNKTVAVILAGGLSTRNQQNAPNQFVNVKGKPVIIYAMEAYQRHPAIDEIYVVCLSGWENIVSAYARNYGITKLKDIIPSGSTGALSVKAAVEWLSSKTAFNDIVIFQESTRPMVTEEMISNTIRCTREHGSAITFEPMDEYLQFMKKDGAGVELADRSKLISIQSPEAYLFSKLYRTFFEGIKIQHAFDETCCAMVMYNLGKKLVFCEGTRYNIKIVRQEDLRLFEALIDSKLS